MQGKYLRKMIRNLEENNIKSDDVYAEIERRYGNTGERNELLRVYSIADLLTVVHYI